jgi:hypothetical protein
VSLVKIIPNLQLYVGVPILSGRSSVRWLLDQAQGEARRQAELRRHRPILSGWLRCTPLVQIACYSLRGQLPQKGALIE